MWNISLITQRFTDHKNDKTKAQINLQTKTKISYFNITGKYIHIHEKSSLILLTHLLTLVVVLQHIWYGLTNQSWNFTVEY